MNDMTFFYLGYFKSLILTYEHQTGRTVGADWRLVLHEDDYAYIDDRTGNTLADIGDCVGVPVRAIKNRYIELADGEPEDIRGRAILVPPDKVAGLGVD